MTDDAFISAFETCQLKKEDFSHEGHVRMAYLYLKNNAFADASTKIHEGIQRFARHHGLGSLYDEKITSDQVQQIYEAMAKNAAAEWESFKRNNAYLFTRL